MECPTCKEPSSVLDTRKRVDGSVKRRRVCVAGHRFSTTEDVALAEGSSSPIGDEGGGFFDVEPTDPE